MIAIFNKDMVELTGRSELWQKEVYHDAKVQIVLISIPVGEEIGTEPTPPTRPPSWSQARPMSR